eukprot:3948615-Lingulodinium_polyedra.AAC.1
MHGSWYDMVGHPSGSLQASRDGLMTVIGVLQPTFFKFDDESWISGWTDDDSRRDDVWAHTDSCDYGPTAFSPINLCIAPGELMMSLPLRVCLSSPHPLHHSAFDLLTVWCRFRRVCHRRAVFHRAARRPRGVVFSLHAWRGAQTRGIVNGVRFTLQAFAEC